MEDRGHGDGGGFEGDGFAEEAAEADERAELLKDRFRLSVVAITTAEAKKVNMEVEEPVVACIADLAYKIRNRHYLLLEKGADIAYPLGIPEQLARDVELFSQHAGRKSVNMEDVILSAHRNEHLTSLLRSFSRELKGKEPQTERKRKKTSKKDDKAMLD